jgi:3-hydroxyacyl-[acyl-carrier-protein] dehydratase
MRFTLIDRVQHLEPGVRIVAVKNLSLAEEYLADHFPGFPCMPGVLMLEAMTQAAAWLVRVSDDFAHSTLTLKEARNVKYANFVEPGQTLTITAEITGQEGRDVKFKAKGEVDGAQTVSARLVLARRNQADDDPERSATDQLIVQELRKLLALLYRPAIQAA